MVVEYENVSSDGSNTFDDALDKLKDEFYNRGYRDGSESETHVQNAKFNNETRARLALSYACELMSGAFSKDDNTWDISEKVEAVADQFMGWMKRASEKTGEIEDATGPAK